MRRRRQAVSDALFVEVVTLIRSGRQWRVLPVLIFLEVTVGAVLTVGGSTLVTVGLVGGRHDPAHGGAYIVLAGLLLVIAGLGTLIPGLVLRMRHPAKWVLQLIPLAGIIYWLAN